MKEVEGYFIFPSFWKNIWLPTICNNPLPSDLQFKKIPKLVFQVEGKNTKIETRNHWKELRALKDTAKIKWNNLIFKTIIII